MYIYIYITHQYIYISMFPHSQSQTLTRAHARAHTHTHPQTQRAQPLQPQAPQQDVQQQQLYWISFFFGFFFLEWKLSDVSSRQLSPLRNKDRGGKKRLLRNKDAPVYSRIFIFFVSSKMDTLCVTCQNVKMWNALWRFGPEIWTKGSWGIKMREYTGASNRQKILGFW